MADYRVVDAEKLDADLTGMADEVRILADTDSKMSLEVMTDNVAQANSKVDSQSEIIAQIKTALQGKAGSGGDGDLSEIESLIDESGVLDNTEGTVTDKVEQVIDKAESENIWYVASKYINFTNQNSPFWSTNRGTEKTIPRINFAENSTAGYLYSFSASAIEYIDYYMDTKNGTEFSSCFSATRNLKWMQGINISNAKSIADMFNGSSIERIIEPLDFTNVTSKNKWNHAPNLADFRIVPESYKLSGEFPYAVYTPETIQSIIDGLAYVTTAQTLTLNSAIVLTDEQKATINSKGWTLAQ